MYKKEQRKVTWGVFLRVVMRPRRLEGNTAQFCLARSLISTKEFLNFSFRLEPITAHKMQQAAAARDMLSYL